MTVLFVRILPRSQSASASYPVPRVRVSRDLLQYYPRGTVDMAAAAEAKSSLLQLFWELSSLEEGERLQGGKELLTQLKDLQVA